MQSGSLEEFQREAVRFASHLKPGTEACVVALSGDLGTGKTTFTQAIAAHFGIVEQVASPTFVIEKIYEMPHGAFERLIHIDAYRLKGSIELEALGWHELAGDPKNLIIIEWPERVPELIPPTAKRATLTYMGEETRSIEYDR